MKAFDLAGSTIDVSDCFGLDVAMDETPSFTSTVRVGFTTQAMADRRTGWWSREINLSEYQLYRWLRDHGADEGETVLVCWRARSAEPVRPAGSSRSRIRSVHPMTG